MTWRAFLFCFGSVPSTSDLSFPATRRIYIEIIYCVTPYYNALLRFLYIDTYVRYFIYEYISRRAVKSQTLSFGLCGKGCPFASNKSSSFFQCTSRDRFSSICSPCAAVLPKPDGFPFSLVEPFSTSRRSAPRSPYLHCGSDLHYLPLSRGPVALHLTTS